LTFKRVCVIIHNVKGRESKSQLSMEISKKIKKLLDKLHKVCYNKGTVKGAREKRIASKKIKKISKNP